MNKPVKSSTLLAGAMLLAAQVALELKAYSQTTIQWTQKHSGSWPAYATAAAPVTPAVVLTEDGFSIYRSVNAGSSWTSVSPFASFPGNALAFTPGDPSTAYSGRSHGIMKSVD